MTVALTVESALCVSLSSPREALPQPLLSAFSYEITEYWDDILKYLLWEAVSPQLRTTTMAMFKNYHHEMVVKE